MTDRRGRTTDASPAESADADADDSAESDPTPTRHWLVAHVQPTFLAPAVAMAVVGGLLAPGADRRLVALHAGAVALAVYAAHLRDGYVDRFVRDEEPAAGATESGLRIALAGVSAAFFVFVGNLWLLTGGIGVAVSVPLWLLAVLHAPYLDEGPVGVTVDYAVGVAIAVAGGYAVQTGTVSASVLATAVVLALLLAAVKISVDQLDYAFDASVDKRTVPVVLGRRRADWLAAAMLSATALLVVALAVAGTIPSTAAPSAVALAGTALAVFVRPRERSVRIQIGLTYPFSAIYVAGVCLGTASTCGTWLATVV